MKLPVGVSGLLKVMDAHGWTHQVTHGTGTVEAQTLGEPRGDGTRPKVKIDAPCESIAIRARHEDTGRAVRALFVCRTDKDKRAWTMSTAWRGGHADRECTGCQSEGCGTGELHPCTTCMEGGCGEPEHTPRQLTTTELRAYLAEQPDPSPDSDADEDTDMIAHAAEIAEKLQGAHERRQRGEDKDMAEEATTEQVQQFGASVWDDDPMVHALKLAERLEKVLGDLAASGHAPGDPQASAVSTERVVELERELADAKYNAESFREQAESASKANAELHALLDTAYVAREVPWSDVAAGSMTIARDGTPWMVTYRDEDGGVGLRKGADKFPKIPRDGETVRVLVPYVTPEQAEKTVADELGAVRA